MPDIFPPWPLLLAFVAAVTVLAVTPGPGVLYIVTRALTQGRAAGIASVLGVALGNWLNAAAASLGLAALLLASEMAFAVLKYAGAAYLVWLGVQALRKPAPAASLPMPAPASASALRVFRDGVLVALLNPKTTLFFAAFLPQFMDASRSATAQALGLGTLFVVIALLSDTAYVLLARGVAQRLRGRSLPWARWATAGVYFGLGAMAALSSAPQDRVKP